MYFREAPPSGLPDTRLGKFCAGIGNPRLQLEMLYSSEKVPMSFASTVIRYDAYRSSKVMLPGMEPLLRRY
nr:hypothetical protein CFP56_03040 [Quercus suber]